MTGNIGEGAGRSERVQRRLIEAGVTDGSKRRDEVGNFRKQRKRQINNIPTQIHTDLFSSNS